MQQYDEIILGSSLSALLHAFRDNLPIFFTAPNTPFRFDCLSPDIKSGLLKLPGRPLKSLTTPDGENQIGMPKLLLWERVLFILCLDGKVPLSNLCHSIRYDGERVVCSNEYSKIFPNDKKNILLENWHQFEIDNPQTFGAMYQFWVKKS